MSMTSGAIQRSRVTLVLIGVLLLSGIFAYREMPKQMDPGFIVRTAQIVTFFPGASPDRVEQLVTDPIEQEVQALPELDFISSTSRTGVSIVAVNIREEFKDVRPIWDSLRRKINNVRDKLPEGVRGPQVNDELGDTYPMLFSLKSDGFSGREMSEIAESTRDQLLRIKGVAKVELVGSEEERVFVEYDNARLRQLGLDPMIIKSALSQRNIIMPGGQIDIGPETLAFEPSGNFVSVEDLKRTLMQLPRGGLVYLEDVAQVTRAYVDPPGGLVSVEGWPGITFAVSMSEGHNLIELGRKVETFFEDLHTFYPHGIDFELTYFQPQEVEAKVDEFLVNVIQAVLIVLAVMLLTLGLRTGLVVAALIPSAMVITIWLMSLIGESINQMSLASLIIALGLLVDNAIVVSESVIVKLSNGESAFEAAVDSCKELQTPLLVSSLTTAAAFLPIFLAESNVGEYTGSLFKVVSMTLLVSWALAMTMTPLLCVMFLRPERPKEEGEESGFARTYRKSLQFALNHRLVTLVVTAVVFFASLQLWALVPQIFFPSQDSPFFMAALELPSGTRLGATQDMSRRVDAFVRQSLEVNDQRTEGVTSWTTFLGETPPPFTLGYTPSPSEGGYCELMVHTTSVEAVRKAMDKLNEFVLAEFPDVQPHIRMLATGPPVDKPVEIRISGSDLGEVFRIVDDVRFKLSEIKGTMNIDHNWGARTKKIAVEISDERARRAGVSHEEIARSMQGFLSGTESTRYREGDESIPVLLRSTGEARRDLDSVRNLSVFSSSGQTLPLSQVASMGLRFEPPMILRRDRYRTVTVEAGVKPGVTAIQVFNEIKPWLDEQAANWPLGYRYEFGGEFESSVNANASIGEKLPIAFLIIVLLLVSQFNSIRKPIIVLSTIVLALIGVVIGLVVMKSSFGFMTLLGVVSLAGIVINNAIVLLDRIQLELEAGKEKVEAIMVAAQQRVRPILLTTATTVASLIPLYLSGGEMWKPMAVAIAYGLVFSTALTLLVVPTLYHSFYRR